MDAEARSWRQRLKPLTGRFGVTSRSLWQGVALAAYRRKRESNQEYRDWLAGVGRRWVSDHWGTTSTDDQVTWEHTASQIFELTRVLRQRIGDTGMSTPVLDAGASDGSFLSLLGIHRGIGVNFLKVCTRKIRTDGHRAVLADLERLPFRGQSFERVICCETLEHVSNPIAVLHELGRICRRNGRIHLSIPWLPRTRVSARPEGWPEIESHIFEFSDADFRKIVTHSRLTITYSCTVQVFPEPRNPCMRWWLGQWMYSSYFPRLQYYELGPMTGVS